jgi:uncharacterized RDD family membrane protein YckC
MKLLTRLTHQIEQQGTPKQPFGVALLQLCCVGATVLLATALPLNQASGQAPTPPGPPAVSNPQNSPAQAEAPDQAAKESANTETNADSGAPNRTRGVDHEAIVVWGRDVVLKASDSAEAVVVIGGSAKIYGKVREAVVAIGGDIEMHGEARDVVAVGGSLKAFKGAKIKGNAVAVVGNLAAEQGTEIDGDPVAVAGSADIAEGATVHRRVQVVDLGPLGFLLRGAKEYLLQCVFKLRPLAPQIGWLWVIAGTVFLIYLLVAAVFPRPVAVCVEELNQRPATTFFLGLLAKLLVPIVSLILICTGIGILVVPFLSAAVLVAGIVGRIALAEWLGLKLGRSFGGETTMLRPIGGFLIGTLIITLLYLVPVIGFLTHTIVAIWGFGCAVTAAFGKMRRERPEKTTATVPSFAPPAMAFAGAPDMGTPPPATPSFSTADPAADPISTPAPARLPEVLSYPKAGFWERMGAGFLDCVLIIIVVAMVQGSFFFMLRLMRGPSFGFLVALAYFAGMWTWKGTTVGGIVLGLKVVRQDDQPITFAVALVRALAGAFSIVVLFFGILWVAFDHDKQGWHDKIAGTVVLRLPKGTPLVML